MRHKASFTNGRYALTESISLKALNQVPIQGGRYVRAGDIPQPYRDEFIADSHGATMPLPDGEAGACFFAHDYQKWLTYRREPGYAPRYPPARPVGPHDE